MVAEKLATAKSIEEALKRRSELGEKELTREEFLEELRDPQFGINHYLNRLHRDSEGALLPESAKVPELQALEALLKEIAYLKRTLKELVGSEWFDCGRHPAPEGSDLPTPQALAVATLGRLLEQGGFRGVLPDGTMSEANLADPEERAAEIQRIISKLEGLQDLDIADPAVDQVLEMLTADVERQIVSNLNPAIYISDLISERYGLKGREVAVPKGTRDEAAFLLAHHVNIAKASLEVLSTSKLSCEHERVYAGGNVSPGNSIFTPREVAQHCLDDFLEWRLKDVKLGR